ncbi:MAG: hypothetical protein ABSC24_11475 [Verrucomicrobiota bacterium]
MDTKTGKRTSLRTGDEDEASQIIHAKNQALRQPVLNMQIAKAYPLFLRTIRRAADGSQCVVGTGHGAGLSMQSVANYSAGDPTTGPF